MSGITLKERLVRASEDLKLVEAAVARSPGRLSGAVEQEIHKLSGSHSDVDQWLHTLSAREKGRLILLDLDKSIDIGSEEIAVGGVQMCFSEARLFFVQGYLSVTWALADRISEFASTILCVESIARDPRKPANLVPHFIRDGKSTTSLIYRFSRDTFGWPVGLAYAIRNLFLHDCAHRDGWDFFEGPARSSGFRVGQAGWEHVEKTARDQSGVDTHQTRAPEPWPWPQNDLRKVLEICHREMDDALGTLLGSACAMLKAHVGFLLGEM